MTAPVNDGGGLAWVDQLPRRVDEATGNEYVTARFKLGSPAHQEWHEYQVAYLDEDDERQAMPNIERFFTDNWSVKDVATGGIFR